MPDNPVTITSVTSQYATQVARDLESNTKEQERISAELSALQAQLKILQDDQNVLHSIHETLGSRPASAPSTPEPSTSLPQQTSGKKSTTRRAPSKTAAEAPSAKKTTAQAKKDKTQGAEPKTATASAQPTLIALILTHLDQQKEPRSAAEVTSALAEAHPQRTIKSTGVRTTLENLVAKNQAQRSKQGGSVFYTSVAVQAATQEAPAPVLPQTEQDSSKREKARAVSS
ncbi:BlaI/MecI/CopY family transcriptional regulator [Streptomyces sp. NPDC056002]|uniref:BlaI/MecI/CopY family transcriptional regulator n=1 Tax=Streptomyces sp. NPDC056002 TaxID=3345675 RepID=UPI0035E22E40